MFSKFAFALLVLSSLVTAHYTLPSLIAGGSVETQWLYVRKTNNFNSQAPVTDVTSNDLRCYNSETQATASTLTVSAGSTIGFQANGPMYHQGFVNVYMAKAPGNVSQWDGSGKVWFKVHEIPVATDGGNTITFPATNIQSFTFNLPSSLPSGQYLIRAEQVGLHSASSFGGAQFFLSCGQLNVVNGGNGNPGPLVSIPGVYTGNEPGILINIYWPIPATWTQPGPSVWRG
ncbi:hypothetical protein AGABI2DRAFT_137828 [Agaricus bisporus var. bisporus H97]|uniref:hypothetical protein n=1 Tax=Agaricus bisporus var. bisporus (strain H97 / ATCC MYA-4626 / FGSC 10389) TaxID=936046 RepID=UPI00029F56BB|nr:hypothetical protein AGABI2DRAFT_137828 [Agaricus bisporus var. bisporus H97]EKV45283.1 hypothetical protein AGABI2DRAFT_137828 [Agaricus bisporus var. bisporus H97]